MRDTKKHYKIQHSDTKQTVIKNLSKWLKIDPKIQHVLLFRSVLSFATVQQLSTTLRLNNRS